MSAPWPLGSARHAGFTLVELLVVIAILGLILGIFGLNLMRSLRQNQLREAASQLAGDLRRSRADAQKTGQNSTLTLAAGKTTYTRVVGAGAPQVVTVPNGVTVMAVDGGPSVTYRPPFGTLGAGGAVWEVQSPAAADLRLYVNVVGITGKVMISAAQD
ncbi:prepilin-type N-terminal cleavage/methylation domain-containing protein [Deinococcus sp.]|uniref:prepilin-type N-terminal cleavage/methylation domain-containing protein n=1 Tax=Deinococcus sp. TaxID=47478 RepID=UPI002869CFFE|nr:prepilin-type N-terminal cleavage/methylation domain-containing protein [Deinococcus sp.]